MAALATRFEESASPAVIVELLDLLRAFGLPFERLTLADLEAAARPTSTRR